MAAWMLPGGRSVSRFAEVVEAATASACRSSRRATTARRRFTSIRRPATASRSTTSRTARRCPRWKSTASPGSTALLRTDILQDVGESISPLVDRGQIEGGFIQGVGWLTLEELLWDAEGRLATAGASTYKLPSWSEMPPEFHVNFLTRAAEPGVVFGSKAVGEPPLMLAISVREAIRDAVAAFGPGIVEFDSPGTPERVFFAVQRARAVSGTQRPRKWEPHAIREPASGPVIVRSTIFHTPRNPFREAGALESYADGGTAAAEGASCRDRRLCRRCARRIPTSPVHDLRGGFVLPGFVDTHVHFPQLRIIGGLGRALLDWLERVALPEEVRMADPAYARAVAGEFVRRAGGARHDDGAGVRLAFRRATACLFEAAAARVCASSAAWCSRIACCPSRCATPPSAPIARARL